MMNYNTIAFSFAGNMLDKMINNPLYGVGYAIVFLMSLAIHESAHAWTADYFGDPTARHKGRVSLNPLVHVDIFWSFLMPVMMLIGSNGTMIFGGGKPVPVNVFYLRQFQKHQLYVALAGPATNYILCALFFGAWWAYVATGGTKADWNYHLLLDAAFLNYVLGVFNSLPIPPLDGFSIPIYFVDRTMAERLTMMKSQGMILLLILLMTGIIGQILGFVIQPLVRAVFWIDPALFQY